MKNLSAILRLSLSEAFTILITLVVCLACFTEAEVYPSNKQKEEKFSSKETTFDKNIPYTQQTSMTRGDELQQKNFANIKHYPNSPLEKLIKRHSDYFEESDDSDLERESDGYGYDDDEYYHVNYKRNEDTTGNSGEKSDKESLGEINQNMLGSQKQFSTNRKDNDKELKTIEMLNFKEIHPKIGSEEDQNSIQNQNAKPFSPNEAAHKKTPSADPMGSLKVIDFKENSAIDETMKDRKDEAGAVLASSDSKISESKKAIKSTEEKDSVKLKESKLGEDSEKKEKEAALKEGKDTMSAKNLKESSKSAEDKEKNVKLSDSAKLEGNLEKMNSKSKVEESSKLVTQDKDDSKFTEKISADIINPKEISQMNNRASFVSNDYKDNMDAIKSLVGQGDEKNSEEFSENEKNIGLTDYQDLKQSSDRGREKQFSLRKTDKNDNFDFLNEQYNMGKIVQEAEKVNPYLKIPANFEIRNDHPSEFYKKRESWKDQGVKVQQQQQIQQQQQQFTQEQQTNQPQPYSQDQLLRQQQQIGMTFDQAKSVCPSNFPSSSELENTDYHRNYLKSLRRYKVLSDNTKNLIPDSLRLSSAGKNSFREKTKRSKTKKRRSMLSAKMPEEEEKTSNEDLDLRRNMCKMADVGSGESQKCIVKPHDSSARTVKEETTVSDNNRYEDQSENSRRRRKSQKFEYEIKVINQNQQDSKNAQLSHFSGRLKKDAKAKLSSDNKYVKKYPFSQVSRDDLMNLSQLSESDSEKKNKRKAPIRKRSNQNSVIRTRAAPSGYYSNRVKFGQKNYAKNNEKTESDPSSIEINQPYHSQMPSASFQQENVDKNNFQRVWDSKQQNYKHDPMKRYDENSFLNKGNSLLLVKKGERTVKAFEEGSTSKATEDEMDRDQLAKILSKDNEYVVLKRTEGNKFRKISEAGVPALQSLQSEGSSTYSNKKSSYDEQMPQDSLKINGKQILYKNKGLHTRSSHSDKNDKKFSASFRSSNTKSNLRKTLDKFRDLADFFKDSEQESADNHFSAQEVKEGRDIVFSEDKLPDPIVISSDGMGKDSNLKQKPLNSIYSISTNFKNLDQQDKKSDSPTTNESPKNMLTSEAKADNTDFSWEPALKSVFPEAKTINAMNKNGNEIIVLDFNRNQLKTEHALQNPSKMSSSKTQQFGSLGSTSRLPVNNPTTKLLGDQKVQLVLNDVPSVLQISPKVASDKFKYLDKMYSLSSDPNGAYAVVTSEENQPQISLHEITDLSNLLKSLIENKPTEFNSNVKVVTKKSPNAGQQNKMTENYNQFLQDLTELSDNKNKKLKLSEKRNSNQMTLPSSSFSELSTYSDANIRQLGNLLQSIMTKDNPLSNDDSLFDSVSTEISKNTAENQAPDQLYQNTAKYEMDPNLKRQGQWLSDEKKGKAFVQFNENKAEEGLEDVKKEIENILQGNGESKINEKELWEELAAASDKVNRLRREGMGKRKLRKAIEDALSFSDRRDFDQSESNSQDKLSSILKDYSSVAEVAKNEGSSKNEETKESSEAEKSLESNYDSHLTELFENLNANKNQKNPSESSWNRKKRKECHRRKRFSRRDVKNKVSNNEVQNTILKNLAEANYQSVYSPGIKRRLLSTNVEAEDADSYSDADEHDKNVLAQEPQTKCVKNAVNECVDPMIVELFGADDSKEEKNRARRSLVTGFHSDFKREIDLDESMPNDFQNFLVTSLGGFGSQTREVIKKDDAFWDEKLNSLDNNEITERSSANTDAGEDSALEKREVSSKENRKGQSYKNSGYFLRGGDSDSNLEDIFGSLTRSEKKIRSEDKSSGKTRASEYADEKLPTQIRIQITNASGKEKKSSKPIMDESETTSNEMENLPKEKEFFDKNKLNPLLAASKLQQLPKNKFSYNEYEDSETRDIGGRNKPYRPHQRKKRKKKKYISEDAMKPVKDFIAFDQKAIESLLKKQHKSNANTNANANSNANPNTNSNPNLNVNANANLNSNANALWSDQTTQKIPVSNHLPQVETVYNPTQGTNKAQLEANRLNKINSLSRENSVNVKNGLQANEASSYNEGVMRSYFKADKIKSDKGSLKEYEEADWKPAPGRMKWIPEPGRDSQFGLNTPSTKPGSLDPILSLTPNPDATHYMNPYSQNMYDQKILQQPFNNYFYRPSSSIIKSHSLYDALKLKQELKNRNALSKDHLNPKPFGKPYYFNDNPLFKADEKDKNQNAFPIFSNPADSTWNPLEHPLIKKPYPQMYKNKDFYLPGLKNQSPLDTRLKNTLAAAKKFSKNLEDDKTPNIDTTLPSQPTLPDISKEADYLEALEDDYLDEDAAKETLSDEIALKDRLKKKMKLHESPAYHLYNYKNSDVDDNMNDEDDEFEDEYDESSEEDDLDDYSLLANTKSADSELSKNARGSAKFLSSFHLNDALHPGDSLNPGSALHPSEELNLGDALHPGDSLSRFNFYYPQIKGNSFIQTKFNSKFESELPQADLKNDFDAISGSSGLLKNANENANIFGKNLIKNLNGYGNEDPRSHIEKIHEDKSVEDIYPLFKNKLSKRKLDWRAKLKRSHLYPLIGSRLFYAAKTEVSDAKDLNPLSSAYRMEKSRNSRHAYRRLPAESFLDADLANPSNDFESKSDEIGKHFNEKMINLRKRSVSQEEEKHENVDKDSEDEDFEDMEENLENDGETISDDNVLENVIGKYIMKKKVKPSSELSEASQKVRVKKDLKNFKVTKRSVENQMYSEETPKIINKRLSSGHLTENNFRKYHKKNLNGKRQTNELDSIFETSSLIRTKKHIRKARKKDSSDYSKRSALDLFKKITNKDRDNKKAENADGRTAGFEPLLSLSDKKYDSSIQGAKEALVLEEKKMPHDASQMEIKSSPPELKAHYPNEGQQRLKAQLVDRKKEKTKEAVKEQSTPAAQGPWKIELNDKYNLKESEHPDKINRKGFQSLKDMEALPFKDRNENLKGFLVITRDKNVRASKRNSADTYPKCGSFLREVGNNYRPKTDEGSEIYNKQVQKRSLLTTKDQTKNNYEDAAQTSCDHSMKKPITKSRFSIDEKNRALRDRKSLSEGDSKPQPPHVLQRNTKKNSFVTTDEQKSENSAFLSKEKLNDGKSVFTSASDANIIRDSRPINEETSEYLGQQIVDAILSHVSENPKFKELIAPGLSKRTTTTTATPTSTTTYSQGNTYRRALHEMDFSEQLQSFLQKFMLDLEKLAEKQVKKRMCHKIDKQSKQFLQSLLSVPAGNSKDNKACDAHEKTSQGQNGCEETETVEDPTTPSFMDVPETTQVIQNSYKIKDNVLNSLRKKQTLLLKLIDDYQNLSNAEKGAFDVNYKYLLRELDRTNAKLASPNDHGFSASAADSCGSTSCKSNLNKNSTTTKDYEFTGEMSKVSNLPQSFRSGTAMPDNDKSIVDENQPNSQSCPSHKCQTQTTSSTCPTSVTTPQPLPVLYFHEVQNPSTSERPKLTTPSSFEKVHPVNISELCMQNQGKKCQTQKPQMPSQQKTQMQPQQNTQMPCQQNTQMSSQQNNQMPCQQNTQMQPQQNTQMQPQQNTQMPCQQNTQMQPQQNTQMPCQENTQAPCQQNSQMPCQQNTQMQPQQNTQMSSQQNNQMPCQQNNQMPCQQNTQMPSQQNSTKTCPTPSGSENYEEATQTPESFDLLPSQLTAKPPNQLLEENVRIKQSLPDDYSFGNAINKPIPDFGDDLYQLYSTPTELHKLSLGDAAGLQLSLKYRGPWVSNLDVAKTLRSTPSITDTNFEEKDIQPSSLAMDVPFVEDFKTPRSQIAPYHDYFTSINRHKSRYYYRKPVFPYHLDKKFYAPKTRPFGNFDENQRSKDRLQCKDTYFLRKSPPMKKISYTTSSVFARPLRQRKRFRKFNSLKYQLGKKKKRVISQFLFRHPKKLKNKSLLKNKQTAQKV